VVAPVLHELRRELNSIPLHTSDASNQALILPSQHMLQSMPKLMEYCFHLKEMFN
jgi:hypothetical protein